MEKILIDSDICLDVIVFRMPHATESAMLFEAVEHGKAEGVVSAESFTNIYYILRKFGSAKKARRQIADLRLLVEVGEIKTTTVDKALKSSWTDFEDAVQYFCAVEHKCDAIVTRNLTDYKKSDIPVMTPHQYLNRKQFK